MNTSNGTVSGRIGDAPPRPADHLMIVHRRYAPDIISGRKSIESRLGKDRRSPFGRVNPGDRVFIKASGGPVFGVTTIERVDEHEDLEPADIDHLRAIYEERICGGEAYWDAKADARFATLIWLGQVRPIRDESAFPAELLKPSRNAWRTAESARMPAAATRAA